MKISCIVCIASVLWIAVFSSCKNDDIPDESYYTFKGETLGQYLHNRPETYGEFVKILQRCRLKEEGSTLESLLNAYGSFTCFAPTNQAMADYLDRYGLQAVEEMTDSAVSVIARMHLINSSLMNTVYETKNFSSKLSDQNMYNKTIYILDNGGTYSINERGTITEKDIAVHNGVIHQINAVLEPSDLKLDVFLEKYPEYSLFREALNLTDVASRLNTEPEDREFVPAENFTGIYGGNDAITPQHRYFYYTCFIETNEVFERAGITDLASMQRYAKKWFEEVYSAEPEILEEGLTGDWADPHNYFNRFVAYHFVNKKIDKIDFTHYNAGMASGYDKFMEFAETLAPGQILCMAAGKNSTSDGEKSFLHLNPSAEQVALPGIDEKFTWSRPVKNGVRLSDNLSRESSNGFFHEIEEVLTFPRNEFKKIRCRFDYASVFPEMMSNAIRAQFTNGQQVFFKNGYLSNLFFRTETTRFYYLNPKEWSNYQGDEIMALGNFDFDIKLPPFPSGQYEVRFGYTANGNRGCAQIYMGDSRDRLLPCGIPVDLTVNAKNYGWAPDENDDMANYESDKVLHANGWMKGPNSTMAANGKSSNSLRQTDNSIRCVVGVIDLKRDGAIYVRFRNATNNEDAQFMMDYIEVCPANIYDNPNKAESRD